MLYNIGFISFIYCYGGQGCLICMIQIVKQQQKFFLIKSQIFTNQPMKNVFNGKFAKPFVQTSHSHYLKCTNKYCAFCVVFPSICSLVQFKKVSKTLLLFFSSSPRILQIKVFIEFYCNREDTDYRNTKYSITGIKKKNQTGCKKD